VAAASIEDVIADLRRAGIEIARGPVKRRDGTALFVHDPDGVRVELQLKAPTAPEAGPLPQMLNRTGRRAERGLTV
jgi:glyoxalase/bleomycin resistance protein/dioxygenase superfamily protein